MKIKVGEVAFHCLVEGPEGAPWITLSHALANNLTLWDEVAGRLQDRFRVLRYDQRGHGKTPAVPGPYSFDDLIGDVLGLWDALGVEKSHWVGLSIGGMIGYGLAIQNPERLLSLTACDSRPDAPPDYAAYFQYRIDTARAKGMAGLAEPTIERWFTPETRAKNLPVLDRVRAMIRSTDPVGHEGCCEALKTLAFGPHLGQIRTPTLILGGERDKGAPPEALAETAARIPGARHVMIPAAGHISVLENPTDSLAALEGFLAEQTG